MIEIKGEKFSEIELTEAEGISRRFPVVTEITSAPKLRIYLPNYHTHTLWFFFFFSFKRKLLLILSIVNVGLRDQNKSQVPISFINLLCSSLYSPCTEFFRELLLIRYVSFLILVDAVPFKDSSVLEVGWASNSAAG